MEKETPVLDVHAANRYLYTQEDMRNIPSYSFQRC